jgi:hypothetical protein
VELAENCGELWNCGSQIFTVHNHSSATFFSPQLRNRFGCLQYCGVADSTCAILKVVIRTKGWNKHREELRRYIGKRTLDSGQGSIYWSKNHRCSPPYRRLYFFPSSKTLKFTLHAPFLTLFWSASHSFYL